MESRLAFDEAIEAHDANCRRKQLEAELQRNCFFEQLDAQKEEQHEELIGKQRLVDNTVQDRELVRQAEDLLKKTREKHAVCMRKEREAVAERKRDGDDQELERKRELIRQIKALEKVPADRQKVFDPTEQPTTGLLEEMSIAELRDRLKVEESRRVAELEEKRERQLSAKYERQKELGEKAETLARMREVTRDEAQRKLTEQNEKKKEASENYQRNLERSVEDVAERIAKKRHRRQQEEMKLKREIREIATKRQFQQANAELVEARLNSDLHQGYERWARDKQDSQLHEVQLRRDVKGTEAALMFENRARVKNEFKAMQGVVDDRLARAKAKDLALKDAIRRRNPGSANSTMQRSSSVQKFAAELFSDQTKRNSGARAASTSPAVSPIMVVS
eukprot:NODE_720_length_2808_cov_10.221932.p2 GENE.NODE_720_length_2808_cov_10.221932~~NODE_720_length_2808_cov_10.221932.p2  ORF type:complete len:393 (-),score=155.40 NODE_720_length_2808_cov_10.221932:468-1646(-)